MFCALLTSRYQVSVYRTNGPLVTQMMQHSIQAVNVRKLLQTIYKMTVIYPSHGVGKIKCLSTSTKHLHAARY